MRVEGIARPYEPDELPLSQAATEAVQDLARSRECELAALAESRGHLICELERLQQQKAELLGLKSGGSSDSVGR